MRLFKTVVWTSLVIILTVGSIALAYWLFPPAPLRFPWGHYARRFRIAKDTTHITDPIDSEGYVDYCEALNRRFSQGVDPQNNRIVALLEATGPKPDHWQDYPPRFFEWLGVPPPPVSGHDLITLKDFLELDTTLDAEKRAAILKRFEEICENQPWQSVDHPQVAAWLERNRLPLDKAIKAMQRPQYFHPVVPRESSKTVGRVNKMASMLYEVPRELTKLVTSRAMLEMGNQDYQAARKRLLSGWECLHAFKPIFIIDQLILRAMERKLYTALHQLLERAPLSLEELDTLHTALEAVERFPSLAELFDDTFRLAVLDEAIMVNQLGALEERFDFGLSRLDGTSAKKNDEIKKLIRVALIDHDELLTMINTWHNQVVIDLKIADPYLRREALKSTEKRWKEKVVTALDDLNKESQSFGIGSPSTKTMTDLVGLAMVQSVAFQSRFAQVQLDDTEEKRRLLLTALALAKHRVKTGRYPDALSALVPNCIKEVPTDLFSGLLPMYQKQADGGYLLYSVGPDRVDNAGRGEEDIPAADDIAVKGSAPPKK